MNPLPDQLTINISPEVPLEMILVRPGYFIMGSEAEEASGNEGPEHIVQITQPFYIGKYPVTQAQWVAVMGNNPAHFSGQQRPVENVSWNDIVTGEQNDRGAPAFLTQLNEYLASERPELAATHNFGLPTEAQWEYAAKGGNGYSQEELRGKKAADLYPTYAGSDRLEACGWFAGNNDVETRPVGLKAPNELGLYDMSGNLWEWCQDWYYSNAYENRQDTSTVDPKGPNSGGRRVLRGGGYWRVAGYCRVSNRSLNDPSYRFDYFGFRLVLSPSSGSGTSG